MSTAKSLGFSPERLARIDRFLQAKYIDTGRLAGVQFRLARGGEVAHQSVLGMADAERGTPLAEDTVFRILHNDIEISTHIRKTAGPITHLRTNPRAAQR